ncbi:unnamed protein product [Calicophoron daubneyi]|uniref:Mevalonate kinase n=1 Tax=Calicophoron daubneyi TaxID=300641 RepID=A0AAV2TLH2_CALDB
MLQPLNGISFTVSAPGKAILFGEHAVVYGHPAIAVSVGLRCYFDVTVVDNSKGQLCTIDFKEFPGSSLCLSKSRICELLNSHSESTYIAAQALVSDLLSSSAHSAARNKNFTNSACVCVYLLLRSMQSSSPESFRTPAHITVRSEIPMGAGLGSSAAFSVAAATTFLFLCGVLPIKADLKPTAKQCEQIQLLAHEAESIVHGKSSGVDTTISTQGGGVYYQRTDGKPLVKEIRLVDQRYPDILLINSNISRSTGDVVQGVAEAYKRDPESVGAIFLEIADITKKAAEIFTNISLNGCSASLLGPMVTRNQELLRSLGLSNTVLDSIAKQLEQAEIPAKLTGAGCGGCIIGFPISNDVSNVRLVRAIKYMLDRSLWTVTVPTFVEGVSFSISNGT